MEKRLIQACKGIVEAMLPVEKQRQIHTCAHEAGPAGNSPSEGVLGGAEVAQFFKQIPFC
jgi:hypothetical protein